MDLVTGMLKAATWLSEELFRRTAGSLHSAVFSGVRSGRLGQRFQEDIDIRERAQRIRAGLPRSSAVDRFYNALQGQCRARSGVAITRDLEDD